MNNQKPIAVFPIAECKKYQRYAVFGSRPNPFENMKSADPDAVRIQKVEPLQPQSNIPKKPVVMKPVAQKVGKHPGGSVFTRRRKTKKGKTIVEQVKR